MNTAIIPVLGALLAFAGSGEPQGGGRQGTVVAVLPVVGSLPASDRESLRRAVETTAAGLFEFRGIEAAPVVVESGCDQGCRRASAAEVAGEAVDPAVVVKGSQTFLVLRRILVPSGRVLAEESVAVSADGDAPRVMAALNALFPRGPGAGALAAVAPKSRTPFPRPPREEKPKAARQDSTGASAAEEIPSAQLAKLTQEVKVDVQHLRGKKFRRPVRVEYLGRDAFAAALRQRSDRYLARYGKRDEARLIAFGLVSAKPKQGTAVEDAQGVLGFYDPLDKHLYVRTDLSRGASPEAALEQLRGVVAHELEHALQDQYFGIGNLATIDERERFLGRRSLYEGEAMLVQHAYLARRKNLPVRTTIRAEAQAMRQAEAHEFLSANGYFGSAGDEPSVSRDELGLMYISGFSLLTEVYERGGFALVDKVFTRPPRTSAQVLDPEKYFTGVMPDRIAAPAVPPGATLIRRGEMGELGTRAVLAVCASQQAAIDAVATLRADSYTLSEAADGTLRLVWATAWSDEYYARLFADLMKQQASCWEQAVSDAPAGSLKISGGIEVVADGPRVAIARGFPTSQARQLHAANAAPRRPTPSLEPSWPAKAEPVGENKVADGRFVSPRLGVEAKINAQIRGQVTVAGAELRVDAEQGFGQLLFVPERDGEQARSRLFESVSNTLLEHLPSRQRLVLKGEQPVQLLGASGREFTWLSGGLELKVATVPICNGKAFLAVTRTIFGGSGSPPLQNWFISLSKSGDAEPPVCGEVD